MIGETDRNDLKPVEADPIAGRPFYGAQGFSKTYNPKKEMTHHRDICIRYARGDSTKEISEATGYTTVTCNYIRQQPWAQEFIALLMAEQGRKACEEALKGGALEAAQLIVEIVKEGRKLVKGETSKADGLKIAEAGKVANSILDRVMGTAFEAPKPLDPEALGQMSNEELLAIINGPTQN